jgi:hypothetical protein
MYGLRIGVRTNRPLALERLRLMLPVGWQAASYHEVDVLYSLWIGAASTRAGERRYHVLYYGSTVLCRTLDLDEIFVALEYHCQSLMLYQTEASMFLRAGVVGWQERAIVLPAHDSTGTSTLVRALVDAGAIYYSDRYAVLDAEGLVHPYAVPLAGCSPAGTSEVAVGSQPLPVGLVVFTQYLAHARWRPRALSRAEGMGALSYFTHATRRDPGYAMPILRAAVSQATVVESLRGEAARVARAILRLASHAA